MSDFIFCIMMLSCTMKSFFGTDGTTAASATGTPIVGPICPRGVESQRAHHALQHACSPTDVWREGPAARMGDRRSKPAARNV